MEHVVLHISAVGFGCFVSHLVGSRGIKHDGRGEKRRRWRQGGRQEKGEQQRTKNERGDRSTSRVETKAARTEPAKSDTGTDLVSH